MYTVDKQFIINNRPYVNINPIGIVVHCTDTPGASAQNERDAFNDHPEFRSSAHAFIDSKSIIQTIPTNEKAWHAGPTANKRYLGVELCMANSQNEFNEIWNKAVWLFADWMVNVIGVHTINADNILSHAEVSERWGETDHMDPIDYFSKYGKTVDMFRSEVQSVINGVKYTAPESPQNDNNTLYMGYPIKTQQIMNRLRMRDGRGNSLDEDGILGSCTKQAIKRFQNICGLDVDGVVGPQTWSAILSILEKPFLQVGSTGLVVRYLQYRVDTQYDGDFGWETNRRVAIWQGQNGLTQDGIVGTQTWNKMIG